MLLDIKKPSVFRGENILNFDITISLNCGELIEIRGKNGSGKTSLLRAVAGFCESSIDRSLIDPLKIHYLGHQKMIKPKMTAFEHCCFWLRLNGGDFDGNSVKKALTTCGIRNMADIPMFYSSEGQKRRLNFARLLLIKRPIWLLDEPCASLDEQAVAILQELIQNHREQGGGALIALHGASFNPPSRQVYLS